MPDTYFVSEYLKLRGREGRLYPDDAVRHLPQVPAGDPLAQEWKMRERSARRLCRYFAGCGPMRILEVGCGNGWLTHQISLLPGVEVTGIDINGPELAQAQRVFRRPNLVFREAALEEVDGTFDSIVFAASFQYFPNVSATLRQCFRLLLSGGSVQIIDTHFYKGAERTAARIRSSAYFAGLEAGAMEAFYCHHALDDLAPYNYYLRNPLADRIRFGRRPVFPWIQINCSR